MADTELLQPVRARRRSSERFRLPASAETTRLLPRAESTAHAAGLDLAKLAPTVRELSVLRPWRSLAEVCLDWTIIVTAFTASILVPHPAVWIGAAFVIAARQHALLILMHEAAHYRILPARWANDLVGEVCCAWPQLVTMAQYRCHHFAHHDHLNSDDDPDWVRKRGKKDWRFPKTRFGLARLLLWDLCGGGFYDNVRAIRTVHAGNARRDAAAVRVGPAKRLARLGFYAGWVALSAATGVWLPLVLWFVALVTFLPMILRVRSIAEHFALPARHELDSSRNYFGTAAERFCFAPHHIGYHLDHHLFPSVPFYALPALHRALQDDPLYASRAHQTATLSGRERESLLNEIINFN